MGRVEDIINAAKTNEMLSELLHIKKEEEKKQNVLMWVLIIPGKVAVLKGDIEAKLPGWEVIVAPNEAVQLVKFLKDLKANGEI